jgi:hypothetical protein
MYKLSLSKDSNPLLELNALNKSQINAKKFKELYLEVYIFFKYSEIDYDSIHQDLSIIAKLRSE